MPVETFPFDASEHLDDAASQAEYLQDALSTKDAALVAHALAVVARARGMTQIAQDAGVDREALYRALDPARGIDIATLGRVAAALSNGLRIAA